MAIPCKAARQAVRAPVLVLSVMGTLAWASTLNQNTSWTLERPGATSTHRLVAYGDSLYAGYNGAFFSVARRAAPYVDGEYLSTRWNADLEVIRRTKSGARAEDIYFNKIVAEKSYMRASHTRVVTFEMCGNDYLQARAALAAQTGTCDYTGLDTALEQCTLYTEKAMQTINEEAAPGVKLKVVSTLYYPGYAADDVSTPCRDAQTKKPVNQRAKFLPYLVHSNWRSCHFAEQYGFACADTFAQFMAADYDSNGDGVVDREALRYRPGESEATYVTRVTKTLGPTLRDANAHLVDAGTSHDYLQSDDVHPTPYSSAIINLSLLTGTGSGSGPAEFSDAEIVEGKNPVWNQRGHERFGWTLSTFNPPAP